MTTIHDRGRIKWAGFYIPEHKKVLARLYEEQNDVVQPILDEQRLEELQEVLSEAIQLNRTVRVTYYDKKRMNSAVGTITKITTDGLLYVDAGDRPVKIPLQTITDIAML